MPECISPPHARITVAPAGGLVGLTLAASRPATCTLSPLQATALAGELMAVAGGSPGDLVTIRPGPVLHFWRNGTEAGRVSLTLSAALALLAGLATAIRGES